MINWDEMLRRAEELRERYKAADAVRRDLGPLELRTRSELAREVTPISVSFAPLPKAAK